MSVNLGKLSLIVATLQLTVVFRYIYNIAFMRTMTQIKYKYLKRIKNLKNGITSSTKCYIAQDLFVTIWGVHSLGTATFLCLNI